MDERETIDEHEHTEHMRKTNRYIEPFPGDAGHSIQKSKTRYEVWLENQRCEEKNPWDPFASEDEWALTMWLINNVGQKATDQFLKLRIVSEGFQAV